jgi:RHH-type proline utilization regulon transcriptional repressor/proline dehydrogenase/delta 1-pyrroline-5-carboxylate dehydrogenase
MAIASRSVRSGTGARTASGGLDAKALEPRTTAIGRELFDRIGRGPRPWDRAWWDDRFMSWTLDDPQVRVQLFRFIDVLPTLRSAGSVRRHLEEYLNEAGQRVPLWLKLAVTLSPPARIASGYSPSWRGRRPGSWDENSSPARPPIKPRRP